MEPKTEVKIKTKTNVTATLAIGAFGIIAAAGLMMFDTSVDYDTVIQRGSIYFHGICNSGRVS